MKLIQLLEILTANLKILASDKKLINLFILIKTEYKTKAAVGYGSVIKDLIKTFSLIVNLLNALTWLTGYHYS